ncbi:hypothetical protein CCB80_11530 [Armatimonadetes bacterium Uphvl-Ar1]|nr:hypothetical protein CCB80_11530 [Armatimonadetes bacterium Uphvl-Ar1]
MNKILTLGLSASAILAAGVANAYVMIDDFSTGAVNNTITSGTSYTSQNGTMLGGDRIVYMEVLSNAFGLGLSVDTAMGALTINSQSGVLGVSSVNYGLNLTGPSNTAWDDLNFDFSGETAFRVNTLSRDGDLTIVFQVRSSPNNFVAVSKTLTGSSINIPESTVFNFSEFAGVNFSNIDQIYVDFYTSNTGDVAVDSIEAVPEPATMVVLASAALAAAARRRRK